MPYKVILLDAEGADDDIRVFEDYRDADDYKADLLDAGIACSIEDTEYDDGF